jgi:tricorn protease interacting factor F2/3
MYRDRENLRALGKLGQEGKLEPVDRWGIQNDLYAFFRCGDVDLDAYLDFLDHYTWEEAYLPLTSMADNLYHAYLVFEGERRECAAGLGRSLLERVLDRIGYEPEQGEKHTTSVLRDQIIWHAVTYGSEKTLTIGREIFGKLMKEDARVHPDILRSIMRIGAMDGEGEVFDWLDQRFRTTESEHERMNILGALGSFRDKGLLERAQQYTLDQVPSRNKFVPIGYMSLNPYALDLMWPWYQAKLEEIEKFHPMHYERVIASIVPLCGLRYRDEVKAFFKGYMEKQEKAVDVIKLSLEKLEINYRMRNK